MLAKQLIEPRRQELCSAPTEYAGEAAAYMMLHSSCMLCKCTAGNAHGIAGPLLDSNGAQASRAAHG